MRYAIKSHIWEIGGISSPSVEMSDWKYSIYIVQLTDGCIRNDSFMTLYVWCFICNNYSIWQVNLVIQPVMWSGWRKQGAYCNRRGVNAYVIMVVYVWIDDVIWLTQQLSSEVQEIGAKQSHLFSLQCGIVAAFIASSLYPLHPYPFHHHISVLK